MPCVASVTNVVEFWVMKVFQGITFILQVQVQWVWAAAISVPHLMFVMLLMPVILKNSLTLIHQLYRQIRQIGWNIIQQEHFPENVI